VLIVNTDVSLVSGSCYLGQYKPKKKNPEEIKAEGERKAY